MKILQKGFYEPPTTMMPPRDRDLGRRLPATLAASFASPVPGDFAGMVWVRLSPIALGKTAKSGETFPGFLQFNTPLIDRG
jgi:hypothetical protein